MALYSHNNEDDIPYFEHIKMFQELEENDVIYIIDLVTLNIYEDTVVNLEKESKTETVYGKYIGPKEISPNREFEYTSVEFKTKNQKDNYSINIHFGTETNCLNNNDNLIICTTEREANQLVNIIKAKCRIQMSQFKSIFHGAGWDYERKHYVCR